MKTKINMKTFFKSLGCLAALICLMSCDGTTLRKHFSDDEGDGGNRNRVTSYLITLTNASGKFYGNYYSNSTSNLYLTLFNDEIAVILDLVMDKIDEPGIVVGQYKCGSGMTAGTFYPGHHETDEEGDYVDGSSLTRNSGSSFTIDEGSVSVASLGSDNYKIEGEIKAGNKTYNFTFSGNVPITDERTDEPGGDPGDSDQAWFPGSDKYPIKAAAIFNGKWDQGSDTDYYTLAFSCGEYRSDGNFVDNGFELVFDILTEGSDGNTILPGTYVCTHDDFTPHHFLDGILDNGTVYPSYFYRQYGTGANDYSLELVTGGSMTISPSEKGYMINVGFKTISGSFAMIYEGEISFAKPQAQSLSTKASVLTPRSTSLVRSGKVSTPRRISVIR